MTAQAGWCARARWLWQRAILASGVGRSHLQHEPFRQGVQRHHKHCAPCRELELQRARVARIVCKATRGGGGAATVGRRRHTPCHTTLATQTTFNTNTHLPPHLLQSCALVGVGALGVFNNTWSTAALREQCTPAALCLCSSFLCSGQPTACMLEFPVFCYRGSVLYPIQAKRTTRACCVSTPALSAAKAHQGREPP